MWLQTMQAQWREKYKENSALILKKKLKVSQNYEIKKLKLWCKIHNYEIKKS